MNRNLVWFYLPQKNLVLVVHQSWWQDGDWEIVQDGDTSSREDALFSMRSQNSRPTIEHLDAMAKVLNEVCERLYTICMLKCLCTFYFSIVCSFSVIDVYTASM